MDDMIGMEDLQSHKDVISDLPDEVFIDFLMLLYLFLDQPLNKQNFTATSPPSAYSISMQSVLPNSSKKALLYEMILGESMEARRRTGQLRFSL